MILRKHLKKSEEVKTKSEKDAKRKRTEERGNVHKEKRKGKEISQSNGEIERLWDISYVDGIICKFSEFGYELCGKDFKTFEFPVSNTSYILEHPGWLNDNVIYVYLLLLSKTASKMGIEMYAFNCHFFSHLRRTVIERQNEKNLYTMISKFHRDKIFESYDCHVIPINSMDGHHWCIVYNDVWKQTIYYYDPMQKGMQDVTATKLIKFYFNLLYEFRSYEVDVASKRFITAFDVCWESSFPLQNDHSSCGVYVLLYASSKLGLLNVDSKKNSMREIRKTIAVELYNDQLYKRSL